MTNERPPPGTIPTLTEIVPWPAPGAAAAATEPAPTETQLVRRVMADLQGQLDLMLEVRVRETLAPILARAGDAIVRDARKELTAALREVVALSVARELDRRDDR